MVRWTLKIWGIPILCVERTNWVAADDDDEEEDSSRIEGGSAHNFERDVDPVTPEDRYQWEWDDKRRFGFRP